MNKKIVIVLIVLTGVILLNSKRVIVLANNGKIRVTKAKKIYSKVNEIKHICEE